jgi:hypothetical protein
VRGRVTAAKSHFTTVRGGATVVNGVVTMAKSRVRMVK